MDRDRLLFAKEGRARFISHLDLMRTFQRAFLRADIAIKHTEGFNPHPFVSIALPLSVGFSSQCELLEFGLLPGTAQADVPGRLNAALPEGVRALECYTSPRPIKELAFLDYHIGVEFQGDRAGLIDSWSELLRQESWVVEKKSKKAKSGTTEVDIAALVKDFNFTENPEGVTLRARLSAQDPGLNPQVLTGALMGAAPQYVPDAISYHRAEALDRDGKKFR